MKIGSVRLRPVELRFARPVRTARGTFTGRSSVILELRDGQGHAGYGEAAPWPGFSLETTEESLQALQRAVPRLTGAETGPTELPASLAEQFASAPAAWTALEAALWDLEARRSRRPLAEVLAERLAMGARAALARVPVSILLVETAPGALRDEARRACAAGYRAAKLKLGAEELGEDVARARAAREGLGPRVALRGDANGAWNEDLALATLAALAPFDFDYVEQPVPAAEIDALARLRRNSPVRIAADESAATPDGAARVIESGAADVVVLKPAVLGGPAGALAVAARARAGGCDVVFTHAFETAVGARHALHCAAAWGDPGAIHGLVTRGLFEEDVGEPVGGRDGFAEPGREPGIGILP